MRIALDEPPEAAEPKATYRLNLAADEVARKRQLSALERVRTAQDVWGLALTYTMIQRMGGSIEVTSAPDKGTTFRLILPTRAGSA